MVHGLILIPTEKKPTTISRFNHFGFVCWKIDKRLFGFLSATSSSSISWLYSTVDIVVRPPHHNHHKHHKTAAGCYQTPHPTPKWYKRFHYYRVPIVYPTSSLSSSSWASILDTHNALYRTYNHSVLSIVRRQPRPRQFTIDRKRLIKTLPRHITMLR